MSTPVVAVTGGIASGKSTLCRAFETLGRTVVDADEVSRELVTPGSPALGEIVGRFGDSVLLSDGALDRAAMRQRVFGDSTARRDLEAILHPRIRTHLRERAESASGPYSLIAVPLLIESGDYDWVDRVLVVDVPEAIQEARVMQRDRHSAEQAKAIMAAQAPRRARWVIANDMVINDAQPEQLTAFARRLDQYWCALYERASRP